MWSGMAVVHPYTVLKYRWNLQSSLMLPCKMLVTDTFRWQVLPLYVVECAEELAVEVWSPPRNLSCFVDKG
jgi:hypothetical protein